MHPKAANLNSFKLLPFNAIDQFCVTPKTLKPNNERRMDAQNWRYIQCSLFFSLHFFILFHSFHLSFCSFISFKCFQLIYLHRFGALAQNARHPNHGYIHIIYTNSSHLFSYFSFLFFSLYYAQHKHSTHIHVTCHAWLCVRFSSSCFSKAKQRFQVAGYGRIPSIYRSTHTVTRGNGPLIFA